MDYVEAFKNLRTNNKYGRKSPHKAVLMLTVIEMYEKNIITDNEIYYNDPLKSMFLKVWNRVLPDEPLFHPEAYLPFWYLQSDSFWHIIPIRGQEDVLSLMRDTNVKPSEAKLKDSVRCAELDEDLYFLMTIASGRSTLKRALLETYTQLSEEKIDRIAESSDNVIDHSLSAMDEYEQILSSKNTDEKDFGDETSTEQEKQFKDLSDDLQIVLNYEYFAFLKNHRSERDLLREVCPNVYALYDSIINHPIKRIDISPSFAFFYDNLLSDLKIALMSEDGSMEIIDKIDTAIAILRRDSTESENTGNDGRFNIIDVEHEKEESIDDEDKVKINDFEVEHVYLNSSNNIVNTITTSAPDDTPQKEETLENRKGKPWTQYEEELLTQYFQLGNDTATIAEMLGRTEVAIKSRLAKLGLIEYTYGEDEDMVEPSSNIVISQDEFKIENLLTRCNILNKKGEKVFTDNGKLKYINGKLYRLNLKEECFSIKEMLLEEDKWIKGSKKIVGYPQSNLYKVVDNAYDYSGIIEDIVDSPVFSECKLKAKGTWYDNNGDIIKEEPVGDSFLKKIKNKVSGILHPGFTPKGKLKDIPNVANNSYDFFWLMAIVEFMQLKPQPSIITYDRVACMVIAIAWELINEDTIVREKEDALVKCIEYLIEESKIEMGEELEWNSSRKEIYQAIKDYPMAGEFEDMVDELIEETPYNILRAWFPNENDSEVIGHSSSFEKSCLYAIHPDKRDPFIEMNKNWMKYLFFEHDNLMTYYQQHYYEFIEESASGTVVLVKPADTHIPLTTNSDNKEAIFAKEPMPDQESVEPGQEDIDEPYQEDVEPEDYNELDDDLEEAKVGYVLRLFPSQKVGSVIEIKTTKSGLRKLVLKMADGTLREEYDNENLYEIIRKNGKIKEDDYVVEKEKRHYRRRFSWDSALEVSKETSKIDFSTEKKEALVGDAIQYDGKRCKVIGKKTSANSMRLIIQYDDGTLDNVPNDSNRYSMMNKGKNGDYFPSSEAIRKFDITNKRKKKATVGDWVMRTSDNQIGKVVEIKKLGSGIEKLILELEDGSQSGVFDSTNLYWVLI